MARSWKDVRAESVRMGQVVEADVAKHRRRLDDEVRAYRLAEVRRSQELTQVEVAARMEVNQSRVSRLESGALDATELGTLRRYVEALGGELRVLADFGDEQLTVA